MYLINSISIYCSHYISTPMLAFDAMLKLTKVKLELLTDIDQILFIEQNIKGGMSYIAQRYAKAGVQTSAQDMAKFFTELLLIDGKR
jgi:hypothetical protein